MKDMHSIPHRSATEPSGMPFSVTDMIPVEVQQKIEDCISHHRKVEAVGLLRAATGFGLAESKEQIDMAMEGEAIDWENLARTMVLKADASHSELVSSSHLAPGEVPPKTTKRWLWWMILVFIILSITLYLQVP